MKKIFLCFFILTIFSPKIFSQGSSKSLQEIAEERKKIYKENEEEIRKKKVEEAFAKLDKEQKEKLQEWYRKQQKLDRFRNTDWNELSAEEKQQRCR